VGRHSPQEIGMLGERSIAAIADYLGDRPFFMSAEPTGVDAAIFAMTASALCPHFDSRLRRIAEQHENLQNYVRRMTSRYNADVAEFEAGKVAA
jgi:glutathione S-transferase